MTKQIYLLPCLFIALLSLNFCPCESQTTHRENCESNCHDTVLFDEAVPKNETLVAEDLILIPECKIDDVFSAAEKLAFTDEMEKVNDYIKMFAEQLNNEGKTVLRAITFDISNSIGDKPQINAIVGWEIANPEDHVQNLTRSEQGCEVTLTV